MGILALLLLALVVSPLTAMAQQFQEDLELILNDDGTLLIRGVTKIPLDNFNARGEGDLSVKAQPAQVDGSEGFSLEVKGSGAFELFKKLNLKLVKVTVKGQGSMTTGDFEVRVELGEVVLGNSTLDGVVVLKASSEPVEGKEKAFRTTVEANVDLRVPIDPEVANQVRGMLGMVNAGLVNMQLAQTGMTFIRFEELDLQGLSITSEGVSGSIRMVIVMDYNEYVTWYKATLYNAGVKQEDIEKLGIRLQELMDVLIKEKAEASFDIGLRVEPQKITYNVDIEARATKAWLDAYLEYIDLIGKAGMAQTAPASISPVEVPLEVSSQTLPITPNITIAEKPIDVSIKISGDGAKGSIVIEINQIYLAPTSRTPGYEGALMVLNELLKGDPTQKGEVIDRAVIALDKPLENVKLKPMPPLDKYVTKSQPGKLVIEKAPTNQTYQVTIEGSLPKPSKEASEYREAESPTQSSPMTQTGTETKEITTKEQVETMQETKQETKETITQTKEGEVKQETEETPRETQATKPAEQAGEEQVTPKEPEEEKEEQAPETGNILGNNTFLIAAALIAIIAIAAILKR